jgi:hypothetical protein
MNGSLLLAVAVAAVGIDYGWDPHPGGGLVYIVQIEPHLIDRLKEGKDISSDIPANVKNIRSFRFTVGSGELPRIYEPPVTTDPDNDLSPLSPPELAKPAEAPHDTGPSDTPRELPWKDGTEDGVTPAMFQGTEPTPVLPETPEPTAKPDNAEPDPPSPWLLATLAIGLMGTSAGMIFTSWTAWDYRGRYRRVLEKLTVEERIKLDAAADGDG